MGFRHFIRENLYLAHGQLYHTPLSEAEHSLFTVECKEEEGTPLRHAKGGHNYYNGRDMERLIRRMVRFGKYRKTGDGWQERYEARVIKVERCKESEESSSELSLSS